jgi:hypothetical protein
MPAFVVLILLVGGLYVTLNGLLILRNRPTIVRGLMKLLGTSPRRRTSTLVDPEARRSAVILFLINGPVLFILGLLAGICYLAPGSNMFVFL